MNNFIVMQGHTYQEEKDLGIIWSPRQDKGGNVPHTWKRMTEVKEGDRIFHYVKGNIVAVSIASEGYKEASKPSIMQSHDRWKDEGYLVKLKYHELDIPVNVRDRFDEILPLLPIKYSPFQRDANGNQGYLYPCNEELAIKLLELISELNIYQVNEEQYPNGEDGSSDQIAKEDFLGREQIVRELSSFYTEYSEANSSPFYIGIFSRWGMGKSSFIEMLSRIIGKNESDINEYIVCKVDCSQFHIKEKLWITILNRLIDDLSAKKIKKVFKFNLFKFKTKFFFYNLLTWSKSRWRWLLTAFLIFGIYCFITKSLPKIPIPKDYKETAALITVVTLVYTLFKTRTLLFKQNVFLEDDRNEESSFIRSAKEYKQLVTLMNKAKKSKNLKILLVLDEMDRMHKELLPDIIELIQLFKGLNNELLTKNNNIKRNKENKFSEEEQNKSVISFVFSFNQDILFPIIGKSVSLDDKQLFINSYKNYEGYVEGKGKDAYLNYYKLGKEFMDKYLDLSLYLEEEIDYTELMEELFKEDNKFRDDKSENPLSDNNNRKTLEETDSTVEIEARGHQRTLLSSNEQGFPSFTKIERDVIKETIKKNASKIEPRKVIRLKNALIMLKKLNKETDGIAGNGYEEELRDFILNFLEIKQSEKQNEEQSTDSAYKEVAATTESSLKDKSAKSEDRKSRQLKYIEYFIYNKN